jgi:ATP/maltotriose-dependent transcriptional regulator MalT
VHPEDRDRVDAVVQRALETGSAIDIEYRIVRPDGRIRRIHGRAEVIFGERGEPLRLTGTAQDVTEIRAAEDALEQTAAELARRAAELHDVTRRGGASPTRAERRLTQRQLEVLRLIADGYSNPEIASRLFLTEGTVKWHVRQILKALGVANRAQAVARLLAADRH